MSLTSVRARPRYGRSVGAVALVAAGLGVAVDLIVLARRDLMGIALMSGTEAAIIGLVAGLIAGGVALAVAGLVGHRPLRLALMSLTTGAVVAACFLGKLTLESVPAWVAVLIGALTGASHCLFALHAERHAADPTADAPALVPVAIGAGVLLGMVATASATVFFTRDRLHLACSYIDDWICADGISYLGIGAALGGVPVLLAIIGAILSIWMRRSPPGAIMLVALAACAAAWPIATTWTDVHAITGSSAPVAAWMGSVLPSAVIAAIFLVVAGVGLVTRRRAASTLLFVGGGGVFLAAVVQPGLGIGLPAAAGMLVAAGWRIADAALA